MMQNITNNNSFITDKQIQIHSADQFSVMAENADSLIFMAQQGRYFYVNPAFTKTTGYTADELYQMKTAWEIVAPEHRNLIKKRAQARESGEEVPAKYEIKIINKDGETRWIIYSGAVINYAGKPAILGSGIDITERKRAEVFCRESELFYQIIFETSGTAMMIFGEDMLISLVNREFEKHSGYLKEEIENKKKWIEFILDDDLPRMKEYHKKRRIDATSVPANYEIKFLTRWGNVIDIHLAVNIIPGTKKSVVSFMNITDRKRVEELLRNSESKYRSLAEDMEALICVFLPDGTLTYVNRVYCEYFQKKTEELVGHSFLDFLPDDTVRQEVIKKYRSLTIDRPIKTYEHPVIVSDGTVGWQRWTDRAIFNAKAELVCYQSIGIDITERKQMEDSLRESEARWQFALEGAGDGVWDWNAVTNEVYFSKQWKQMLGYDEDEITNSLAEWDQRIHPDDWENVYTDIYQHLAGLSVIYRSEHRIMTKDGSFKWVVGRGKVISWTPDGKPLRVIGTQSDITESKLVENALRESEAKYRFLANKMNDIVWTMDLDFRTTYVSPSIERILGFTPEERMNQDLQDQVTPASLAVLYSTAARELNKEPQNQLDPEKVIKLEIEYFHKDGSTCWLENVISSIWDSQGVLVGLYGLARDITERKKAEAEREALLLLLQAMFSEHTAVMLLMEPLTGKIIDVNPAACTFYGYTREELLNMLIQDINLLPKEELKRRRYMVLEEKQRYFLFPHRLKCGEIRLVDVYSCPVIHKGEKTLFSIIFDVTERERYKEELYREKELLRSTLLSISDGVVTTDQQGKVTSINKVAGQLTGWTQEEAFGKPIEEVFNTINEFTREKCENPAYKVLETRKTIELANHTILVSKEGIERPIEDSAAPIMDEDGHINGVVLVFRDFTEKKERQAKIEYLSFRDQLTGLYNRRFFEEELKRLDTERNLPLTLVMADINGLKLTNDAFGHFVGDKLLQKAAEIIKKECRTDDIIARIDGDEFVLLLPKTDSEQAAEIVNRIYKTISNEKVNSIMLSISFGWETKMEATEEMTAVLKKAEDYMYRSKLSESFSMRNKTIKVIIKTLYEKNEREQRHSYRVSQLSEAIGAALELSIEDISELRTVGLMHDIGKIIIDDRILDKPGALSESEWLEIKRHSEVGYRILSSVNEFAPLAEYVLAHHERWDGKGYPKGLKGEEIPLEARIIAVADTYDAMTSDRPYRKALSKEVAIEEIERNAGTQFDPCIARVFVEKVLGN